MAVEVYDGSLNFTAGIDFSDVDAQISQGAAQVVAAMEELVRSTNVANSVLYQAASTVANSFSAAPIENLNNRFEILTKSVQDFLISTFGVDKIKTLDQQLNKVVDDAQGLKIIIAFLEENAAALQHDELAAAAFIEKLKEIQELSASGGLNSSSNNNASDPGQSTVAVTIPEKVVVEDNNALVALDMIREALEAVVASANVANESLYQAASTVANSFDTTPIENLDSRFAELSELVQDFLSSSFGEDELKALDKQLSNVADDAQSLKIILAFLEENKAAFDQNTDAAAALIDKLKELQQLSPNASLNTPSSNSTSPDTQSPITVVMPDQFSGEADTAAAALDAIKDAATGALTPLGELTRQFDDLNDRADRLEATLDAGGSPEALSNIRKELGEIYEQLDVVQARMQQLNGSLGLGQVGTAPAPIDLSSASEEKLKSTLKDLTDYSTRLKEALSLGPEEATANEYNDSLSETKSRIEEIKEKLSGFNDEAQSIASRLREIREQLANMDPGDLGFQDLVNEAAELQSRIAGVRNEINQARSESSGLAATKSGINGLVGAYTAVSSAVALFSDSSEQLQQTMAKLFAVLTIVGGVEQFLSMLSKESAVNQFLLATYRNLTATATEEEAVAATAAAAAEAGQAVATQGAAAAQWSLNAAMAANPVGAFLVAITAIVGALGYFIEHTEDETDKAIKLSKALEEATEALNELSRVQGQAGADRVNRYEEAVNLAQAQGKSEREILDLKIKANAVARDEANKQLGFLGVDKQRLGVMEAQLENLSEQKLFITEIPEKDRTKEQKKQLELLESQLKALHSIYDYAKEFADIVDSTGDKDDQLQAEKARKAREAAIRSATATAEARVLAAKEGSSEELRIELAAIEARRRAALSDVNLTAGEIAKINADAARQVYDVNKQLQIKALEDQESFAKAQLDRAKKGTFDEFNARMALLEISAQKEIVDADGNAAKITQINADKGRAIFELSQKYNFTASEAEISGHIATLNEKLAASKKWSQDELSIKKQIIDEEANLEIAKAQSQIENEVRLAQKIKEIRNKAAVEKKNIDDRYADRSFDRQLASYKSQAERANLALQKVINNVNSSASDKYKAERQVIINNINSLQQSYQVAVMKAMAPVGDQGAAQKQVEELDLAIKKLNNDLNNLDEGHWKVSWQEIANLIQGIGSELISLGLDISKVNSGLGSTVIGIGQMLSQANNLYKVLDKHTSTTDKIGTGIAAAVSLVSMVIDAAAERARAEQEFTQALINQQLQYNLALNEAILLNSKLKDNVFLVNYQGQLRDGIAALTDAQKSYQEAIKALSAGQAKAGQRDSIDVKSVLAGVGSGAVAGAAVGSIVPVIGTAIGAVVGAVAGGIVGLFGGKKKKDTYVALLEEYPELVQKTDDGILQINKDLAQTLIKNNLVSDSTKTLIQDTLDWQAAIDKANEQIKSIIADLAGDLGGDLRDALVDAFEQGTDSAKAFAQSVQKTLDNVISQMIFNQVFGSAFDHLQKQMQDSFQQGGDMNWQDDLQDFFAQYSGLTNQFNEQLQAAQQAAEQVGLSIFQNSNDANNVNSLSGAIRGMSEQQADLLAGQFGGLRTTAMQQLQTMSNQLNVLNAIETNTYQLYSIDARLRLIETQGIKIRS